MGLRDKRIKRKDLNLIIQALGGPEKVIQALDGIDGSMDQVELESLLTGNRLNTSIPGTTNAYKEYKSQVRETYRKYNGRADFGVAQTRSVIDLRTAMIAGEGLSISTQDPRLSKWIDEFLTFNRFNNGLGLVNAVKGSEMCGQSLFHLVPSNEEDEVKILTKRVLFRPEVPYIPVYSEINLYENELIRIDIEKDKEKKPLLTDNFIYVRTGGDDIGVTYGPTTKIGVVLTDVENYDRAIKDMRRNNHITARVTPTFKTKDLKSAKTLLGLLSETKWSIGKAYAGDAELEYKTPGQGAHENLSTELTATIKSITATTGVPVHWMGFVDLMSNRSTADSLYEMIKHATSNERIGWERAMYDLIYKAQELYIDSGGSLRLNPDFQVRLPLLDFNNFLERVKALQIAYMDEAISIDDYRNMIPGIDPLKTAKAIEEKEKKEERGLTESVRNQLTKNIFGKDNSLEEE